MKTYIITLLLLITNAFFSNAQEDVIVPLTSNIDEDIDKTYYYKDINGDLNKFLGTWKYQDADKELIVTFYLNVKDKNGVGDFYDKIYAKFKYTENGTIIYDTLLDNSLSAQLNIVGSSFLDQEDANGLSVLNVNKMSLFYNEPTDIPYDRTPHQQLFIEFLPCGFDCSPQLKWDIFWLPNSDSEPWPFKIPKDITLTKQ